MSTPSGALKGQSSSIRVWLLLLFVALILLVVNTYATNQKNDEERAALVRVNDVQVQSQQIATFAREAAGGNLDAFSELKATRERHNAAAVDTNTNGSPARTRNTRTATWKSGSRAASTT